MIKWKMVKKNKAFKKDERYHVQPSDLARCPRAIQLRLMNAPERDVYHLYRGSLVHQVVEELIKSANPKTRKAWLIVKKRQASIPWQFRIPVSKVLPKYEEAFRNFLTESELGKKLSKSASWIEEKIYIPAEVFNQVLIKPLPFDLETLKKYRFAGKPDAFFSNIVLEFKTGKPGRSAFLQGLMYEKMLQIAQKNPKIINRIMTITPKSVKMEMSSKFWTAKGKFRLAKEEELVDELSKIISEMEKWEKDPNYKMPRDTHHCSSCKYYYSCFNPITRMLRRIRRNARRNWKRVKRSLGLTRKSWKKKSVKNEKRERIPVSSIQEKI